MNANMFMTTVPQNAERKAALFDLWRSTCCATNTPGQPPARAITCNVFSETRQWLATAAYLSTA